MQITTKQFYAYMTPYIEGGICVAFSGGVDSSLVLKLAAQVSDHVVAVHFRTTLHPVGDEEQAKQIAKEIGVPFVVISLDEFTNPIILQNPRDRCYHCKHMLFSLLLAWAKEHHYSTCLDGTNFDDLNAYRPGIKALKELQILSPLADLKITKQEVRALAAQLGLSVSQKPSSPCLATRLPYNTPITIKAINQIATAEALLHQYGFPVNRVRLHNEIARIEIPKEQFSQFYKNETCIQALKQIGFTYITLDIEGFRSGSMDEPFEK